MANVTVQLTPNVYEYLLKTAVREHNVLKQLREQTQKMSMHQMQIAPDQGQLMGLLIELMGAKKTLDIGTFTGYSALVAALAMPADGKVVACDKNTEWTKIAKKYWQLADVDQKIDLRIAPATETLQSLINAGEANTFDFAFIDADKKNYPTYYELALQLVRPGGLMAIDDVLWEGEVANPDNQEPYPSIMREINKKAHQDSRVSIALVAVGDGLLLCRKR